MMRGTRDDVVVVGAGIVGASVAYHVAKEGRGVLLLDRAQPGSGATGRSFGWLIDGEDPPEQAVLRRLALPEYRRLEQELPEVCVQRRGSLTWDGGEPTASGHVVDAARVGVLEPRLRHPAGQARWRPGDGAVDPVAVTRALVAGARAHGAVVRTDTAVHAVRHEGGTVTGVDTSAGPLRCSDVVLANGVDAPALCAPLGLDPPVNASPALLMRFSAPPGTVRTLVSDSRIEVRQQDDRLLVAWWHDGESTQAHLTATGRDMARRLVESFEPAGPVELVDVRVGWRPVPADGRPVVGRLPSPDGAHVAVAHPGVLLAPVVGRLLATEILAGRPVAELAGFGPDRFVDAHRGRSRS